MTEEILLKRLERIEKMLEEILQRISPRVTRETRANMAESLEVELIIQGGPDTLLQRKRRKPN